MIRKLKPAIIVLIHILFLQGICGQVPINMTEHLTRKFLNYTSSVPREEIYIQSDREEYISGEEIWFNVYLMDRQGFKPTAESRIAYFELLNSENRPIVQRKILLHNGFGPGQIELPDTLSSGVYTIRAYTSWMKNFLPANCFTKDIRIFNAFSTRTFKRTVSSTGILKRKSFSGHNQSGLTLSVDNMKPDLVEIHVVTNEKYRSENGNLFYLFIQTHGNINHAGSELITDQDTKIFIPKKQLTAGINQITVFNSIGKPVGERYIFTPDKDKPAVTIHSADSAGLRNKISVSLEMENGLTKSMNLSSLSISVAPVTNYNSVLDLNDYMVSGTEFRLPDGSVFKDLNVSKTSPEIIDSLLQTVKSDWINWDIILADELPVFKFQIEKDDQFLSGQLLTGDPKKADPYKYVLMTPPGKTAQFQYAKTDQHGEFKFNIPIDDKVNDLIFQPDVLTKNGSLVLESPFSDQYLKSGISLDSSNRKVPDYISKWSVNHQVTKLYGISNVGAPLSNFIQTPRIKRFYGKPDIEVNMKDFITLPVMQEVFFELLAGVSLKSKKTGYEMTISDPDNFNRANDSPPALFVDGVAIKDAGTIAGLEPEIVEKIDVVRQKYAVGNYLFTGIVNVITKSGDFSNVTLPAYAIRLSYRVIDPVSTFSAPDYSSVNMKKCRIPDFRNTLYWNPSVKTDSEGKALIEFWTSDFVSDYEVNIQGITPAGKAFTLRKIIKVRR
jgi:hypothetical protein